MTRASLSPDGPQRQVGETHSATGTRTARGPSVGSLTSRCLATRCTNKHPAPTGTLPALSASRPMAMAHTDDFGHEPAVLGDEDFVAYLVDTLIPDLIAS